MHKKTDGAEQKIGMIKNSLENKNSEATEIENKN